jgi:hypothetical protein
MMKTRYMLLIAAIGLVGVWSISWGDEDDDNGTHGYKFWQRKPGVAPVDNALYQTECGSCHFAYQPGLLPERSWRKLMSGLDDHFGDNAELNPQDHLAILKYLTANSADKADFRRSRKIMLSLPESATPLRITETPYFKHEHDEIPRRIVQSPAVGSLSYCDNCHQTINTGSFS